MGQVPVPIWIKMPIYASAKAESGIFHVMLRGINKQIIFEDEEDRIRFIETLDKYKDSTFKGILKKVTYSNFFIF